ncbi:unnamed protein product [marine sediment metagenome]|uniref:Uncharacterized protein n=1 Tax=marine sediment metagenome TaxID=412755 RepID=X0YGL9_9ZZZZ
MSEEKNYTVAEIAFLVHEDIRLNRLSFKDHATYLFTENKIEDLDEVRRKILMAISDLISINSGYETLIVLTKVQDGSWPEDNRSRMR